MNDLALEILQFLSDNLSRYSTTEIAKNLGTSTTDVSKQMYALNDKGFVTRSISNKNPQKAQKKLYKINASGINQLNKETGNQNKTKITPTALAVERVISKQSANTPKQETAPTQQQKIDSQLKQLEKKLNQKTAPNKINLKIDVLDKLTEIMAADIGELLQEIKQDLVS